MQNRKKRSKKGKIASDVMEGCLEVFAELFVYAAAFALGSLLFILFPEVEISDTTAELAMFLGVIFAFILVGIAIVIIYLIKKKRGRKTLNFIYKALKRKYDLSTVTLTRKMHGEYTDVFIIKGKSEDGKFELYRDGEELVFSPDSSEEIRITKADDAIMLIEEFMSGSQQRENK